MYTITKIKWEDAHYLWNDFKLGSDYAERPNAFPFNGSVSNTIVYNRVLSATEVAQNYNALKSRFGLS